MVGGGGGEGIRTIAPTTTTSPRALVAISPVSGGGITKTIRGQQQSVIAGDIPLIKQQRGRSPGHQHTCEPCLMVGCRNNCRKKATCGWTNIIACLEKILTRERDQWPLSVKLKGRRSCIRSLSNMAHRSADSRASHQPAPPPARLLCFFSPLSRSKRSRSIYIFTLMSPAAARRSGHEL